MRDILGPTATAEPPKGLSPPLAALWWIAKGHMRMGPEWQKAHEICQTNEGDPGHDAVHALCHRIEGDHANAAYWYRRAGRVQAATPEAEWEQLAADLAG